MKRFLSLVVGCVIAVGSFTSVLAAPTLYEIEEQVTYGDEIVNSDVNVQVVEGITMVPLRATLEAMGYEVNWNGEISSVDISKGAQWTSITIGENAYFRNKMAPWQLSCAPIIIDDRTLVPVEFFAEIIGKGIHIDQNTIGFVDFEGVIYECYVKEMTYDETGDMTITLTTDLDSEDLMDQTIIHTSRVFTIFQKQVIQGEIIKVAAPAMMTASIPGQTSGYIVY